MSYFKYHEDIEDQIAENKYYAEADSILDTIEDASKKKKVSHIFKRYYVLNKIYYEIIYKINLLNNLLNLKSSILKENIRNLKVQFKDNQNYLLNLIDDLYKQLEKEDFSFDEVQPLALQDKVIMKKNISELLFNMAFTYMNEEPYMDVKELLNDLNALAYWSISNDNMMLTLKCPSTIKNYLTISEYDKRKCDICDEDTPKECCYCLHCGCLIGVD